MIYLYAITEPGRAEPDAPGLDEEPLHALDRVEVAGVYSEHDRLDTRPEPSLLWRHEQVVERLMDGGPALPARFGTVFTDAGGLAAALDASGEELRRRLDRVRGCVELAVRVGLPGIGGQAGASDGRSYLHERLARRREQEAAAKRTLEPLVTVASAARLRPSAPSEDALAASYLVSSEGLEGFTQELLRIQNENPELSLSCTGPWAPYSFATEEPVS